MNLAGRPRRPLFVAGALLLVGALLPVGAAGAQAPPGSPGGDADGARYVPVQPCRLLDTRGADPGQPAAPLAAGAVVTVDVAGECDVDEEAVAAALTVTAVGAGAPGYLTVFPSRTSRPTASTVNYRAGQVIANLQLTRLGDGKVDVFTLAPTHVVVDVAGYFELPEADTVRSGRFVPLAGGRIVDTRSSARPAAEGVVTVDTSAAGVPADASAVVVNLTTDATTGPDVFTAYPTGSRRPTASVLNVDRPLQARAAAAIVPVEAGRFDVFTRFGNHVIVDLLGYFTGASAESSDDGLFVPIDPSRLVDSRRAAGPTGGPRLWDHGGREFPIESLGLPAGGVAALAVNTTVTDTEDAGWLVLGAAGQPVAGTSTVNYPTAQQTVANAAIVGVSERGIQARALSGTHVVLDVTGWFTGAPMAAPEAPPTNPLPPPRKVTIITDSAIAGVRWNGALNGLQGFVVDHRMESCRRLVATSCMGREGRRPPSVVAEINRIQGVGPEDLLVIATGYDDWWQRFSSDFDTVVAAARAQGFRHIAWSTFRSDVSYHGLGAYYAIMDDVLWAKAASGEFPDVEIWDYNAYTATASGWFTSDGIHLTTLGAWGSADWISRQVAAYDDRPCPQPWAPGQPVDDPCGDPVAAAAQRGLPDIRGLYLS